MNTVFVRLQKADFYHKAVNSGEGKMLPSGEYVYIDADEIAVMERTKEATQLVLKTGGGGHAGSMYAVVETPERIIQLTNEGHKK